MWIIRAVAVGRGLDKKFDAQDTNVDGIRPYIKGLVEWLDLAVKDNPETEVQQPEKYTLGVQYEIEYRERDVQVIQDGFTDAENADVLFCMSTFVGEKAVAWRKDKHLETPIVVITSNPEQFNEAKEICGVSALRPQLASAGFRRFRKAHSFTKLFLLHRHNYGPSTQAMKQLSSKKLPLQFVSIKDNDDPSVEVTNLRSQVPANEIHGLFVLPADRFFGWAKEIQDAADATGTQGSAMKTFWSTPDWPSNSNGGYGFPQHVCGRYMAERVASIWASGLGKVPDPAFITVDPGEIKPKLESKAGGKKKSNQASLRKKK